MAVLLIGLLSVFSLLCLSFTISFFISNWCDDGFFEGLKILVIGLLISCIFVVPDILLINFAEKLGNTPKEFVVLSEEKIVALKDNSKIEGSFSSVIFIGSGYINQEMYYYYMANTDKGKIMGKVPSENTYIIETNDKEPSVICKQERYIDPRCDIWLITSYKTEYYIYVPKGTVDTTYKIDLQ